MTITQVDSLHKAEWIRKFPPGSRIIKDRGYLVMKRIMDLALVILSMPLWLPVLGVISLLIWLSAPGAPVMFYHLRTGKGGKRFRMYKFRTMVPNAEELKAKYAHLNELKWPDFKITNDPRVTFLGRILRKTSLDELPQLFNVLRGEMSLVGPRPTSFGAETYQLWHTERLDVIPGLTGLWQVEGRAHVEFDDRLRLDIAYIERASLWLDIEILFRTVLAVFQQKGAH
jgi:lipopolysaccharide/colanic/teichoic acid biosynthesis glycosyltransferase